MRAHNEGEKDKAFFNLERALELGLDTSIYEGVEELVKELKQ